MSKKWKLLKIQKNISGIKKIPYEKRIYLSPDGREVDWYVRNTLGKVIVFALNEEGRVIMIQQFRHGINQVDTALVAGAIEKGYTPLQNAKMELEQESGYKAKKWIRLGKHAISAGNSSGWQYSYLALECYFVGQKLEQNEFIDIHICSIEEVKRKLKEEKIRDVGCVLTTFLALHFLENFNKK